VKAIAILLYFSSAIFIGYGYWGMFTEAGSKKYEEMAGLIPFYIIIAGGFLFLIAMILTAILFLWRNKSR
jgi:hypothetical protein